MEKKLKIEINNYKKLPKIVAFDCFGTVFDCTNANSNDMRYYADTIHGREWKPLRFPNYWSKFPAFGDSVVGLRQLREKFTVVAMSNAPVKLMTELSKNNGIVWDFIIPLECYKIYKPNLEAYGCITKLFDVQPEEILMVSANKHFGDIENAVKCGMASVLLRQPENHISIIDLASYLNASDLLTRK